MKKTMTRRDFLKGLGAGLFVTSLGMSTPLPVWSQSSRSQSNLRRRDPSSQYDLEIGYAPMELDGKTEPCPVRWFT